MAARDHPRVHRSAVAAADSGGGAAVNDVAAVFRHEIRRIFTLPPVFAVMVVGALIYATFYPQPYLNEALRRVPIAVVDSDGTASSREVARLVDATSDVAVAMVVPDLPTAQREIYTRGIYGVLVIPRDFERDLLHDRSSPLALYADASYFLIYQRVSGAVSGVARAFGSEVETGRLIAMGVDPVLAAAAADPMPLTAVPLFNPQGGYATYVLPAAFVLILQQLLLIGVALSATLPGQQVAAGRGGLAPGPVATILGKALAYLAVEAIIVPFYLVVLPYLYGIPRLGSVGTMLVLAVPFVLAVSGLGLVLAAVFKDPLKTQLATAAVGLPFFFLAGFSWPSESMPHAVRLVAQLLPSTSAIEGMVRVAQLGAPLSSVRSEFLTLWALAIGYGLIALAVEFRRQQRSRTSPAPLGRGLG
jgi:ABC-2 type transport system permease protein